MNKPVAWTNEKNLNNIQVGGAGYIWKLLAEKTDIPLYTHPVKEQSNLVNVVKDHIEDLVRCVKLFRSYEMDNTADEMEVAIKELEDAIKAHPVKELTDEKIIEMVDDAGIKCGDSQAIYFARAILRKAQEKC